MQAKVTGLDLHGGPWLEIHQVSSLSSIMSQFTNETGRTSRRTCSSRSGAGRSLSSLRKIQNDAVSSPRNELWDLSKQWAEWDIITCLANYHSMVDILFEYLKARRILCGIPSFAHFLSLSHRNQDTAFQQTQRLICPKMFPQL
jgi:hypothetical protein